MSDNPNPWHRYGNCEHRRKLDGGWELRYLDNPTWIFDLPTVADRAAMLNALHPILPKTITLDGDQFARDDRNTWTSGGTVVERDSSWVRWSPHYLAAALDKIAELDGWDTNDE